MSTQITTTMSSTKTTNSAPPKDEKQEVLIHIPIQSYLSKLQHNHGLLQNDYHQYRQYLTRRISRLRHTKVVRLHSNTFYEESKSTTATTKSSSNKQQYKHAFVNKKLVIPYENNDVDANDNDEIDDDDESKKIMIPHENFLLILLLQAERAWAHGMEYKHQIIATSTQKHLNHITPKRRKQLFLSKFRKSISIIQKLNTIIQCNAENSVVTTSQTLLECNAYEAYLKGNYLLEKKKWLLSCCEYYKCIQTCKTLIASSNEEDEEEVLKFRIDQDLDPVLRFCKYELMEGGMTEEQISTYLEQQSKHNQEVEEEDDATTTPSTTTNTSSTTASYTIQFRTKTISISNEGLCIALLKIDTLQKEQQTKQKTNKDRNLLIQEYDDILERIQSEMTSSSSSLTKKNQLLMSDYKVLKQYISFWKLQVLLQRNEYLVHDLLSKRSNKQAPSQQPKWEDITHVYMLLLQDSRSVVTCLQDNQKETIDDECYLLAQAQVIRYRALYCYALGHCYASFITTNKPMSSNNSPDDKEDQHGSNINMEEYYQKAEGLYEHSLELASMASEELSACNTATTDDLVQSMIKLENDITGSKCRLEAYRYLKTVRMSSLNISLLNRLNDTTLQVSNNNKPFLVDSMPLKTYQYVPCKPTFFDLAWNYIEEMEGTSEGLKRFINELEVQEKGGSSRFLGWFYS